MNRAENPAQTTSPLPGVGADDTTTASVGREGKLDRLARQFVRGRESGYATLPTRFSAMLRRMNPERPGSAMNAIMAALVTADVVPRSDDDLRRWAAVLNLLAILSGTGGTLPHGQSRQSTGRRLHEAGYSEQRLARLLTARGPAVTDQVRRAARFLATARGERGPIDLRPLVDLLRHESHDDARTEAARLRIARDYYGAAHQTAGAGES